MTTFVSRIPIPINANTNGVLPKDVLEKFGIFDTTIRLSIGLENAKDLINDMEQSFKKNL